MLIGFLQITRGITTSVHKVSGRIGDDRRQGVTQIKLLNGCSFVSTSICYDPRAGEKPVACLSRKLIIPGGDWSRITIVLHIDQHQTVNATKRNTARRQFESRWNGIQSEKILFSHSYISTSIHGTPRAYNLHR